MSTKDISIDDVVKGLGSSFESFDDTRQEGLKTSAEIQEVKNKSRQKEKDRLVKKYGEDHPRVKSLESRLSYGSAAEKGLNVEMENNNVKQEPFPTDSWRVNGRVMNSDLKGIPNLTLGLYDENMKWLRDLGSVCTDDNGFFSLTVTDKTGKLFEKYQGKALILTVSKDGKEIIHQEKEPLFLEVGAIEYRQIILGEDECPSPPEEPVEPEEPQDTTWIVKGTVMVRKTRPVAGAVVKITDPDGRFAKLLGQQTTNDNGEFQFVYQVSTLKALIKANPDLFVIVYDANGKEIYQSKDPIHCKAGNVEVLEISI